MSDIVERLREAAASLSEIYPDYAEAADEISRLRAELVAVTAERDRMMKALAPFVDAAHFATRAETAATAENNLVSIQIKESSIGRARAALEGVTGCQTF